MSVVPCGMIRMRLLEISGVERIYVPASEYRVMVVPIWVVEIVEGSSERFSARTKPEKSP